MSFSIISEAFQQLSLYEETFDTSLDGINKLDSFMKTDVEDDHVTVIDPEATDDADLQKSYVGKVITNCNICHSHIFKDKTDIVVDEDSAAVNVDEQCPYCGETSGFTIIGEIKEFSETEQEEPTEETTETKTELEESVGVLDKPETSFEMSQKPGTIAHALKNHVDEINAYSYNEQALKGLVVDILLSDEVEDAVAASKAIDVINCCKGSKLWSTLATYMTGDKVIQNRKRFREDLAEEDGASVETYLDAVYRGEMFVDLEKVEMDIDTGDYAFKLEDVIAAAPRSGFALVNIGKDAPYYILVHKSADLERIKQEFTEDVLIESVNNIEVETDESTINIEPKEDNGVIVTTTPKVVSDDIADVDGIETEAETESESGKEVIAPVSQETQDEITGDQEIPAEDQPEEVDIPIDEVDEESVDEIAESFLKETYSNVESFKTTDVYSSEKALVLEGLITFASGKKTKTGFIFESETLGPNGKVTFVGKNPHLSSSKCFQLSGKVSSNKIVAESLSYSYIDKHSNKKVSGSVKRRK